MANQAASYTITSSPDWNEASFINQKVLYSIDYPSVFQPLNSSSGFTMPGIVPRHYVWLNGKWNIVR